MNTTKFEANLPGYHSDDDWHKVFPANDWRTPPHSHHLAAEAWVERNFADLGYPTEIEGLRVRVVGEADFVAFDVHVESVPIFTAEERRSP